MSGLDGYKCVEWDNEEETSGKLKVGFDVMNDAKLTDTQEKAEDYMVVFAKMPEQRARAVASPSEPDRFR